MQNVKLAVRKEPGYIPGSGFHYMLHPMKMDSDDQAEVFRLMGHQIIELDAEKAERLIAEAFKALNHQVEIAWLVENPGK